MNFHIEVTSLRYQIEQKKTILSDINLDISPGSFVAVLGENGAGKTTLLDLMMGLRKPSRGTIKIQGEEPFRDNWRKRQNIAYLSEKVDIPGDWSIRDFLDFNRFFYKAYSLECEMDLLERFNVRENNRLGNMSAGEVRRVQVVAALSARPYLIIVDEITAVLDIIGRRRFMTILTEVNRKSGCTIVLATNILEDLKDHISHVFLLSHGKTKVFKPLIDFMTPPGEKEFSQRVADLLEGK